MKKIIYISVVPSTPQIEKYLYVREVLEAGFTIEFWDLSGIYFKEFPFKNTVNDPYIRKINSFNELKDCLSKEQLQKQLFIVQVHFEWRVLSLFLILTRFRCKTSYIYVMQDVPTGSMGNTLHKIKAALMAKDGLGRIWRKFLSVCAEGMRKTVLIKPFDFVFVFGGAEPDLGRKPRQLIRINSWDYDRYQLSRQRIERLVDGEYAIFLDEGTVHNEAVDILKMGYLDPKIYFGTLNYFFDLIESKFKVKVIIAAHPGIKYDKEIFQGRDVYEGKSCDLVKDCRFVISQASMSVSFAVLYQKPIIFIYTDEYVVHRKLLFEYMGFLSKTLGQKWVNIDSPSALNALEVPDVNPALYDNYKYTYLTSSESENRLSKEIVANSLAEL